MNPNLAARSFAALRRVVEGPLRGWAAETWRSGSGEVSALPDRVVRSVAIISALGAAALMLTHLVDFALFDLRIGLLNADLDWSVWGWAGVVVEFAAVVGAVQLAILSRDRWRSLTVLAALMAFLSADDFLLVHEKIADELGKLLPVPHAGRFVWPLVFLPIMAIIAVLLWRLSTPALAVIRHSIRMGLGGLVVAVLLEMSSSLLFAVGYGHHTWPYEIEVAVEEALEMAGWMLIAGGLAALVLHRASAMCASSHSHQDTSIP